MDAGSLWKVVIARFYCIPDLKQKGDGKMSVVKAIEILAESTESWEKATQTAVAEAAKTVRGIQTVYINNMQAIVEGNEVVRYRVDAKITFIVQD